MPLAPRNQGILAHDLLDALVDTFVQDFTIGSHLISSERSHFGASATVLLLVRFFFYFLAYFWPITGAFHFKDDSRWLQAVH